MLRNGRPESVCLGHNSSNELVGGFSGLVIWPKFRDGRIIDSFVDFFRDRLQLELLESSGNTLTLKVLSGLPRCGEKDATVVCGDISLHSKVLITVVKNDRIYARWANATPEEIALANAVNVERRADSRKSCSLRVISSNLPGTGGLTQNIGSDGLQILCCDAVATGQKVEMSLAPGESGTMAIKLEGEVRWCRRTENGHLAGVSINEDQQRRLKAVRNLVERTASA